MARFIDKDFQFIILPTDVLIYTEKVASMRNRFITSRFNPVSLLFTVFASLFFTFSGALAEEAVGVMEKDKPEQVLVLKPHELKVVIPGDSVWRVARRLSVSVKSILGLNPEVAGRDEPGREQWLYKDMDTLKTPLLHSEMKNPEDVSDSALIAVSMEMVRANKALITKMRGDLTVTIQALSETNKQLNETGLKLIETSSKNSVLEDRTSVLLFERNFLAWIVFSFAVTLSFFIILLMKSKVELKDSRNLLSQSARDLKGSQDTLKTTTAKLDKLEADLTDLHHRLGNAEAQRALNKRMAERVAALPTVPKPTLQARKIVPKSETERNAPRAA
ncbi:MAG: LysM domain-containing protein [bacterium]|nr:LysM domain-containing protein [bacterium]